jgi:Short C-terminal domain
MFRRRRPLLRAAAVGGGAYLAGKARQRSATEQQQRDPDQREAQQPAPQPNSATGPPGTASMSDELSRLSQLHEQGALTDTEFAAAKANILGT